MIPERDLTRLRDMIQHGAEALEFAGSFDAEDFENSRITSLAVIRCIEVVGEAAAQVSLKTRAMIPRVMWPAVIGQRNILIHAYWRVNHRAIVKTLREDLPVLIATLEAFLAEHQP